MALLVTLSYFKDWFFNVVSHISKEQILRIYLRKSGYRHCSEIVVHISNNSLNV